MPRRKPPEDPYDLRKKPYWRNIKLQFSDDELELFIVLWSQMVGQFKEDVLPTEEMQIIDVIKLEILLNRLLKQQNFLMTDIARGEELIAKMEKDDDVERIEIAQESIKLKGLRQEYDNLSKEIRDTMKEKQRLFEQLKATRSQRVQKIDGKQTFNLWMQKLMNDYGLKKKMGLEMEKMRLASEAEKKRLAALHTYANLEVDRPFLNADTVQEGD